METPFFRCAACSFSVQWSTRPFCEGCDHALKFHRNPCWWEPQIRKCQALDGVYCLYKITDSSAPQLKAWKRNRGLQMQSRVLGAIAFDTKTKRLFQNYDFALPLGQNYSRAWQLGGSSSLSLAQFLQRKTGLRYLEGSLVKMDDRDSLKVPFQAQRDYWQRNLIPIRWKWKEGMISGPARRVLIVDDFWTSGRSLESAALCIRKNLPGLVQLDAFVLGLKIFPQDAVKQLA